MEKTVLHLSKKNPITRLTEKSEIKIDGFNLFILNPLCETFKRKGYRIEKIEFIY